MNIVYMEMQSPASLRECLNVSKSWLQGMDPNLHSQKMGPVFRNREEQIQHLNSRIPAYTCIFLTELTQVF